MTDDTSLVDESATDLTAGILRKVNREQARCLPAGKN